MTFLIDNFPKIVKSKMNTLASLQGACNAGEWLTNHRENLRANSESREENPISGLRKKITRETS